MNNETYDSNENKELDLPRENEVTDNLNYEKSEMNYEDSNFIEGQNTGSLNNNDPDEQNIDENNDNKEQKTSVRRLSLFDTEDDTDLSKSETEQIVSKKTEPIFRDNSDTDEKISNDLNSDELNPEEELPEDDINQESEEELLDIPTFLRRQAN